ncbi:MAG: hypothetical protein WC091_25925 [Sulfuricellaceae bacterium]
MNERQPVSPRPRLRLQELLSIPERQRSDEQWDEINDLEITLASANRMETRAPTARVHVPAHAHADQPKPNGGEQGKKPFKKPRKHTPRERESKS